MRDPTILKVIKDICARDTRYRPDGYLFVLDALEFTTKVLQKSGKTGKERHVGGRELVEGIRHFALQEYGPMALRVLTTWGIQRTEDFGEMVFNLVESGKLRKTDDDTRTDFANGYDFTEAFTLPFLPECRPDTPPRGGRGRNAGESGKRPPAPDGED